MGMVLAESPHQPSLKAPKSMDSRSPLLQHDVLARNAVDHDLVHGSAEHRRIAAVAQEGGLATQVLETLGRNLVELPSGDSGRCGGL